MGPLCHGGHLSHSVHLLLFCPPRQGGGGGSQFCFIFLFFLILLSGPTYPASELLHLLPKKPNQTKKLQQRRNTSWDSYRKRAVPSPCTHISSLAGLSISLQLMLTFGWLSVSQLCCVSIWLPWKTLQRLPLWTAVADCDSVNLPLGLHCACCSPLFIWDVFICLR